MKKFLLSLLALFSFSAFSFGASIEYPKVTMAYTGTETTNMAEGNNAAIMGLTATEWSVIADKGANSNMPGLNKAGDMRLYWSASGGNTITVSSLTGATIEYIEATFTGDSYSNVSVTVNDKAVSGTDGHYNIGASSFVLGNANTANTQVRISKIDIYYSGGEAATVAAPVITPASGTFLGGAVRNVTMTCETEGAEIRYRISHKLTNGMTEMQKDYSIYTEPFGILAQGRVSSTVTAWAVIPATEDADEQSSAEVKVTYTYPVVYTSIYEANSAATPTSTIVALDAKEWLVTYVDGRYTYLTDGRAGLLLYGSDLGLEQGQKVSGIISGGLKTYNGLPEVENPDVSNLEIVSEDNEVVPIVVAASKLEADKMKWVNMFITVTMAVSRDGELDVAEGSAAASYNFASQGTEFVVRNQFKKGIFTSDGYMYDVTGFYAIFNENGQIYPTAVDEFVDPIDVMGDVTKYYIQNPSFDVDEDGLLLAEEKKGSNGPLDIAGWTMSNVGTQFNNTEIRQANSSSTTSAFGTSDPSDGEYSLFFRQGWNRDGVVNEITLETDAYELPEGQYMISVDYKQTYAYDVANVSKDTKIRLSLELDDLNFGEAETEAAPVGNGTYFNDTEWSTLKALVNVDYGDIDLQGSVSPQIKITLFAAGDKRSDFFLDNVRIYRISEEDLSRMYLEDVIAQAEKLLEEPYGQLFTKVELAHNDLEYSVEEAQGVLDSEAPTAYDLDQAARNLLIAIETYEGSDMVYPDDDAKYTIKQKVSKLFMTVNGGTKLAEEPMAFTFSEDADGGWTIYGDGEYVGFTGTGNNTWSMGTQTEYGTRWRFSVLPNGSYQIAKELQPEHFIGTDNTTAGSSCYCNKGATNETTEWIIEEYKGIPIPVFTVSTERGAWMFDAANNRMHYNAEGLPEDIADDFKFALIEKDGHKFLYSLGAQKFVQPQKGLVEGISTPVVVTEGDGYSMMKAEKANLTINIGGQWTWDTWTSADGGNKLSIQEVDEFDATDAIAMLDNTPIDQHKVYTITTRRGQWAASADGKSLGTTVSNAEATDADKQFAFYYDGAEIYIYSVGAKKFIKSDGSFFAGKTDPVDYRLISNDTEYPYCFYFTGSNIYFNMQGDGARYAMNTWSSPDDGNKQKFGIVDVDVYDEMKAVFEAQPIDVVYEVYWNDKMVASATVKHVPGDEIAIPAELDRGLCTLEPDITEIEADTKVVKLTATWNDLFKFSESFEDAVWYNMDIRSGWQVYKCETEPYYMKNDPTEEELASPEFQWAFAGDPYNIVVYNKSLSGSWSLAPVDLEDGMHCVGMREGEYTWDLFGNADGFVLREAKTLNNFINQSGGGRVDCPLSFWTGGRNDDGSTFRVVECNEALELAVDVDYYKGQNGLNYEIDFTEALEFLGIESLDEATIAGVDVTTDVEVENYTIFDGWRNANGDYEQWGENAAVCVKFIEEPEQFAIYDMGNDNVPEVGETFVARFHIKTSGKTVVYNINVNFVEPPLKYLADYTEKGSFDVTIFAPEKGVAFDGEDSEEFSEAEVSDLIGVEWGDIFGKGFTDEVGETFATEYTNEPAPGFWCLEDGTADVEENGAFAVSLIPAEDWTSFNFRAWTKEAIEENLTTTFYLVNEETKEYVAYNITLSAKPAVNLVGEFDGMIKQILSHPQTGKQGEATGEQTVTIAEGEEEGTYDVTYSGFVMPITGAILPEFTIHGVEAEIAEDGTTAKYVLPAWAPQSITIDRGTGTVTYKIQFEGTKDGNDMPILKLTLDNSVIDEVWFGPDEEAIDEAIADGISTIKIAGTSNKIFDLSGRQLDKVQKSGIYIVNGKKVSIK